jgi:hypothetical protein
MELKDGGMLMVVQEERGNMQLKLQSHCEPKRSRILYGFDIMRAFSWKGLWYDRAM